MMLSRRVTPLIACGLAVLALAGCQTPSQQQHSALVRQNRELQRELDLARAAADSAESERMSMAGRLAQLQQTFADYQQQQEQQAAEAKASEKTAAAGAFDAIDGVETEASAGRITVRVPGDVLFESGKAYLRPESQATLAQVAGVINGEFAGKTVRIHGYTDTDAIRKSEWTDNLELSLQRAAAVHRFLQTQKVEPSRMVVVGYGPWRPRGSKAESRRVEIVVVLDGPDAQAK